MSTGEIPAASSARTTFEQGARRVAHRRVHQVSVDLHTRRGSEHPAQDLDTGADVGGASQRDLDPFAANLPLQLLRRTVRDRVAVVDHHDVVRELVGFLEILGRQQQRRAGFGPAH